MQTILKNVTKGARIVTHQQNNYRAIILIIMKNPWLRDWLLVALAIAAYFFRQQTSVVFLILGGGFIASAILAICYGNIVAGSFISNWKIIERRASGKVFFGVCFFYVLVGIAMLLCVIIK